MFQVYSVNKCQSCIYLQQRLNFFDLLVQEWGTNVNPTKCKTICFTKKHYGVVVWHKLTLGGEDHGATEPNTWVSYWTEISMGMLPQIYK